MGKNIRRGRTGNVRCASCGQLTRRDRAVYLFKNGIKSYYCPDCAKKVHGSRLYKGMPKFVRRTSGPKVKRKFAIYSTVDEAAKPFEESNESSQNAQEENQETTEYRPQEENHDEGAPDNGEPDTDGGEPGEEGQQ